MAYKAPAFEHFLVSRTNGGAIRNLVPFYPAILNKSFENADKWTIITELHLGLKVHLRIASYVLSSGLTNKKTDVACPQTFIIVLQYVDNRGNPHYYYFT